MGIPESNRIGWSEILLRLLFPPKCIFCSRLLDIDTAVEICSDCYEKIPFMPEKNYESLKGFEYDSYWDEVICVCEYEGIVKEAVLRYKFFDKPSYCRAFSALVMEKLDTVLQNNNFDMILGVPLHKRKKAARGYNQSLLITKQISRKTGIPERSDLLRRVKDTKSQSTLTREARYFNVRGAFEVLDEDALLDKNILIFDDILTTGYTLNECSRVLKEAGARRVVVVVIASPGSNKYE